MAAGAYAYTAPFWTLPNQFLTGASAAVGIALINSVGNLGGFVGPYVVGLAATKTGSLYAGVGLAAAALFTSAALVLTLPTEARPWRTFAPSGSGNVGTEPA
jgi:ACS family tartrate transporter-like MFS transporter